MPRATVVLDELVTVSSRVRRARRPGWATGAEGVALVIASALAACAPPPQRQGPAGVPTATVTVTPAPAAVQSTGAPAASTAAVVDGGPVVLLPKNADEVARFPSEVPIAFVRAKILASVALAHERPRGGNVVATLQSGTDVTKISSTANGDSILVQFTDPGDANSRLIGWLGKEAFSPTPIVEPGRAALSR
jgi:hypothetical protein